MNLFNDSFLSPAYEATANHQYQYLSLQLKNLENDNGAFQLDMEGAVAFGAPLLSYTKVTEIYFQVGTGDGQRISLGRHKINWSGLDTRWNFGVWQPLFKVNPLSAESQGLLGLFWEYDNKWSALSFFASPLYIPNQGPSFDIDSNGQFVKSNPWFQRPPDSIRILKEVSSVEYAFDKPSESSIVLQSSYSARGRIQDPESGSFFQLSYAYKPMNSLALVYDGVLDIAKDRGSITIQPNVYYHSLIGGDLVWGHQWVKLGSSIVTETPQKTPTLDPHWNYPVLDPAQIYSGFVDLDFKWIQISVERIQVFQGEVHEVGELASPSRPSITSRFPFTEANRFSIKNINILKKGRKLNTAFIWTESAKNQFKIMQLKSLFQISSIWSVYGDLQLVQASDLTIDNQNDIAQYANNDRISFGASYVF